MRLRYARRALAQLDRIYEQIAAESPASADKVKRTILRSIERLERFPYLARATSNPAVRVMPVLPYPYLV